MTKTRGWGILVLLVLLFPPSFSLAQSQFAGKWHNKRGRIVVSIVAGADGISGELVFADFRSDLRMPIISGAQRSDRVLNFRTKDQSETFQWRLTLYGKTKGRLVGAMNEMIFDERVKKER